jgi:biopolymer transport protein ExbD
MQIKKFDSINVVPMIDIMLVLLVIVLTTATFIAKGVIPLQLPEAKASKSIKRELKKVDITISKDNRIFFDKEPISRERLDSKISTLEQNSTIFIFCDRDSRYESFVTLLDALKSHKISKINIVTKKIK